MTQIKEILNEANPWWKGAFKAEYKERAIYKEIERFLDSRLIIALTGLRRVGKTTILLKIVEDKIKEGFDPSSIIFFPFDEQNDIDIRDIIKEYEKLFGKSISPGKHILILDEIQKLAGWENKLKWIYDLYSKDMKILISGSESLFIRKRSKEALAGRLFEFKVTTLSFKEFVAFKGQKVRPIGLYDKELDMLLEKFVHCQGFPELVGRDDKDYIKRYITDGIVEKAIYRDIPGIFNVRDTASLNSILRILMEEPGQLIENQKLAKELKISRYSVSLYLRYLEDSFLVRKLYNYSRNARKSERTLRKYYPAVISSELAFRDDDIYKSRVFEWLIVSQLDANYFWRDQYNNEVDVVSAEGPTPIEVKYGRIDEKGLLSFMDKFSVTQGYIISSEVEEERKMGKNTIKIVPARRFLLEDGTMPQ
jgi:predicted AAA+ superfamily ATPase